MKVAIIGELPPANVGGVGMHVLNLSLGLSKYVDVTVISTSKKSKILIKLISEGDK